MLSVQKFRRRSFKPEGSWRTVSPFEKNAKQGSGRALPALEAAVKALNTLNKRDIDEIKTFPTPPTNVEKTMDAVLILLDEKGGWANAKIVLSKIDFMSRLLEFDKDNISPAQIRKLQKFAQDPEFVPDVIEKTSLACRSLCMWVHAINKYYFVARDVAPKRQRLAEAEGKLASAKAVLKTKEDKLAEVVAKIRKLEKDSHDTAERKADLERQIVEAEAKLHRADQLIGGLASERSRWGHNSREASWPEEECCRDRCAGRGLCCIYWAVPNRPSASAMMRGWTERCKELGIPVDDNFSLESFTDQKHSSRVGIGVLACPTTRSRSRMVRLSSGANGGVS